MSIHYRGTLYRALNPIYAREPLSGKGAELHGGRFNAKGVAALYASITVMTALREANQVGSLQPTTLVSYDADIDAVFDTRDEHALAAHDIDPDILSDPAWRDRMRKEGEAPTQALARRLAASGHTGILVRTFGAGSGVAALTLVLWWGGPPPPPRLTLIDDENRLSR